MATAGLLAAECERATKSNAGSDGPLVSDEPSDDGMTMLNLGERVSVDYLVLADASEVAGGKQYIHSAGWDAVQVGSFPVLMRWSAAIRIRVPLSQADSQHVITIDVQDDEWRTILTDHQQFAMPIVIGKRMPFAANHDHVLPMSFDMSNVIFPGPGKYWVTVSIDKLPMARTSFFVVPQ